MKPPIIATQVSATLTTDGKYLVLVGHSINKVQQIVFDESQLDLMLEDLVMVRLAKINAAKEQPFA